MATPPIDWQYRLSGQGLDLYFNTADEPDDYGCLWGMNGPVTGWDDGAEFRGTSVDLPWADGADIPDQYFGKRSIHATGLIIAPDAVQLEMAKSRLTVATRLMREDGRFGDAKPHLPVARSSAVRRGGQTAFPNRYGPECTSFDILLVAGDPLKYGDDVSQIVVSSSTDVGGISFPLTFPVTFTSDSDITTSTKKSTNIGDVDVPYQVRFNGPLFNPVLVERITGARIPLLTTIPETKTVVVDTGDRTVTIDGDSVYDWLNTTQGTPLDQLRIPAGGECQWVLLGQGSGNATVVSKPAWE